MKKIININLASRLIPIEDSAYELLSQYLESLKRYFSQEEGADEIVGDIESRIAEIFQDKLRKGAHCITDEDVLAVKASMGTPEQFGDEHRTGTGAAADPGPQTYYGRPRKRFYRDPDGKVLGGICNGLGSYFNIDPIIFRIIFALLAIMWGGGILLYLILWIATPAAETTAEKLEMRGERVDLNNIRATVREEMHAFRGKMGHMGEDVRNFSVGRGKQFGSDAGTAIERFFRGVVDIIIVVAKGFFLFLGVVILFSLVAALVAAAIFSPVLFPAKDLLLTSGIQSILFWPALTLLVGIPVLGLVMFLIRKLTGIKSPTNKYAGYMFGFLWIIGVVMTIWLCVSVSHDFRTRYKEEERISIAQPSKGKLIIKSADDAIEMEDMDLFDGSVRVLDDTVIIGDIDIRVVKSQTDSFAVEMVKSSRGGTVSQAKAMTRKIQFSLQQQDSILYIPGGFSIPRDEQYRCQRITLIISVPVGKNIQIDQEVWNRYHFIRSMREEWWDNRDDWGNDNQINIKMTPDGWEKKPAGFRQGPDTIPVTDSGRKSRVA